jgi:transcriptional regulator with GAF, ATPase, and Fis domain
MLLSEMSVTLSLIFASMKNVAASDEELAQIHLTLGGIASQLNELAQQRFPTREKAGTAPATVLKLCEIGASSRHQFTYCSPRMHAIMQRIERAAKSGAPVLITGETGVGKELIARFIHVSSPRKGCPLVPINCAAIPRDLFEDQLFGHRQGAFTGAVRSRAGAIRSASGGTLFLDEIGEMPLDLQPKLLRFLQEGEVQPVGESRPLPVDVRIVASTNRDLEAEVKAGRFRADLLHRLKVISFEIPPLRERPEDIPLLLDFFLARYSRLPGNRSLRFAQDAVDCLCRYGWPGNVRQLSSLVLQLVSLAEEDTLIFPADLPDEMTGRAGPLGDSGAPPDAGTADADAEHIQGLSLGEAITMLERRRVYEALSKNDWNYSRAARHLGLSTYGLRKKYRRLFGQAESASLARK